MDEASGVGRGVAHFLTGYTIYKGEKYPFEAVAYGRIGGQNVMPTLTPDSVQRLESLHVDMELFTARLPRQLVDGELTVNIPQGATPPENTVSAPIRFLRADWNKLFAVVVCFQIAILA